MASGRHGSGDGLRTVVFITLVVVLSGFVPVLCLVQVPDMGRSRAWILTAALMCWAGVRLAHRIADGRPRLFDFVFWLFVYIFMGLAPTAQIRSDQLSGTTPGMDPTMDLSTAGIVWLGVLAYEIGRWLGRPHAGRPRRTPVPHVHDSVSAGRTHVLFTIAVVASAYYLHRVGVSTLFTDRTTATAMREAAFSDPAQRSIIQAAGSFPLVVASGAYALLWRQSAAGRRIRYGVAALGCAGLAMLVVNPISSARYTSGTVIFALAIFAGIVSTVRRSRFTLASTIAGFLWVFPLADAFRSSSQTVTRNGFFGEYVANADYDAFWQIGNALAFWRDGFVVPFRQLAGVVLFWVPRSLWADKPVDTGILLAQYRGYTVTNLSAPLWAELLVNGGIVLLIAGFLAFGALMIRIDLRIDTALLGAPQWWTLVGGVFPMYMVILLRGSFLQATGILVVSMASMLWVRKQTGRNTGPPLDDAALDRIRMMSRDV